MKSGKINEISNLRSHYFYTLFNFLSQVQALLSNKKFWFWKLNLSSNRKSDAVIEIGDPKKLSFDTSFDFFIILFLFLVSTLKCEILCARAKIEAESNSYVIYEIMTQETLISSLGSIC